MEEGRLFLNVKFFIAQCTNADEIKAILIEGGGQHINYLLDHVTHVIADTNCPVAEEAVEVYEKPVVSSLWVRQSLKAKQLLPTEAFSPLRHIFHHVVASFSSDLSPTDVEVLAATLTFYGAKVSKDINRSTHFIVPSSNTNDQLEKLSLENAKLKVVAPDWILESVRQNCACDENLFSPDLLLPPKPPTPPSPCLVPDANEQQQPQEETEKEDNKILSESNEQRSSKNDYLTDRDPTQHLQQPQQQQYQPQKPPQSQYQQPTSQHQPHLQSQKAIHYNQSMQQTLLPTSQLSRPRMQVSTIVRGPQPRFRPLLPPASNVPNAQSIPLQQQQQHQMGVESQQPNRITINYGQYRKPTPNQNNLEPQQHHHHQHHQQQQLQQPQQPQQLHPQPAYRQMQQHIPNQQPQHQQGNMFQNRPHQPHQVYHQVRPTYQTIHLPPRGQVQQPNINQQQPQIQHQQQPQMINRFQDQNTQMNQRPYQVSLQPQSNNSGYNQSNVQRQQLYYHQTPNQLQMRLPQQQGPPQVIRHLHTNEQIVYENNSYNNTPHHSMDQQPMSSHPQHYVGHSSQQTFQQQPHQQLQSQQIHSGPPAQSQTLVRPPRPQPQASQIQQQHQQLSHPQTQSMPPSQQKIEPVQIRHQAQFSPHTNPPQMVMNSQNRPQFQTSPSPRVIANNNHPPPPQPHPSIFDHTQESNLAEIRAKVPNVVDDVNYYGHDSKEALPKNLPLTGCSFCITDYQHIHKNQKYHWLSLIKSVGGIILEKIENATHLICEDRLSSMYAEAMKRRVRCVTIYWLNDIYAKNLMTYPWKALHLPLPFSKNDPPLIGHTIAITNFKGRERCEVREMILKSGARYTEYFSSSNTLIICGNVGGEKYEKAVEWRTPIANCRFLSDVLTISNPDVDNMLTQSKYQLFDQTNLMKFSSHAEVRSLLEPWTKPVTIPSASSLVNGETKNSIPAVSSNDDSGILLGESNNSDNHDVAALPNGTSVLKGIQYSVNGLADSLTLKKEEEQVSPTSETRESNEEVNKETTRISRKSREPVRILFTHLNNNLVKKLEAYARKLELGFATSPINCTHLITDCISRTSKFVCAFSHAAHILSYNWIIESHEANDLLDEKQFILQDREGEEKYSFNLVCSLLKRRKRVELLFNNMVFFVTPSVFSSVKNLKEMIESAGGVATTRKPPSKLQLTQLKAEGKRFVIVTCEQDYLLCSPYEPSGVDIVGVEFVVSGILRQDIDFKAHRFNSPRPPFIRPATNPSASISVVSPPKKLRLEDSSC